MPRLSTVDGMAVRLQHIRLASLLEFASKALLATAAPAAPAPMAGTAPHSKNVLLHVRHFAALPAEVHQAAGRQWADAAKHRAAAGGRQEPVPPGGLGIAAGPAGPPANPKAPKHHRGRHSSRRHAARPSRNGQEASAAAKHHQLQRSAPEHTGHHPSPSQQHGEQLQAPAQQPSQRDAAATQQAPMHHQQLKSARTPLATSVMSSVPGGRGLGRVGISANAGHPCMCSCARRMAHIRLWRSFSMC